jgi:hypothetical protein
MQLYCQLNNIVISNCVIRAVMILSLVQKVIQRENE